MTRTQQATTRTTVISYMLYGAQYQGAWRLFNQLLTFLGGLLFEDCGGIPVRVAINHPILRWVSIK